jgi:hypothetical protein
MSVETKANERALGSRVLKNISHGGHLRPAEDFAVATTPFDYLFADLAEQFPNHHLPSGDPATAAATVAALTALGTAMIDNASQSPDPADSIIPPIYTYWGQFIDHDLTANTDRTSATSDVTRADLAPVPPATVKRDLRNLRLPALNLDSVYGDGPTFDPARPTQARNFYDGIKFVIGELATIQKNGTPPGGGPVPPVDDLKRDLPRDDKVARIGDARNDENLIVAQLHVAFLRFHNAVVDWVRDNESGPYRTDQVIFNRARQLTQWHYQWLVVHDFLPTITTPGVVDQIRIGGNALYTPREEGAYMPLEFSVASYRFGHSMVRAAYDYNLNFGRGARVLPNASFNLIFAFTGAAANPFLGNTDVLPNNWAIQWDRFVDKGSTLPDRFARKIDTRLVPPLFDMTNQVPNPAPAPPIADILKRLAIRNLLRGYALSLPTGQAIAQVLEVPVMTHDELQANNTPELNAALTNGGFLDATPLWYYVLKEAEVRSNGHALGPIGSHIVAETIIGQVRADPDSYANHPGGWSPSQGITLPNGSLIVTIKELLQAATVL